jgi:hypothetical protein
MRGPRKPRPAPSTSFRLKERSPLPLFTTRGRNWFNAVRRGRNRIATTFISPVSSSSLLTGSRYSTRTPTTLDQDAAQRFPHTERCARLGHTLRPHQDLILERVLIEPATRVPSHPGIVITWIGKARQSTSPSPLTAGATPLHNCCSHCHPGVTPPTRVVVVPEHHNDASYSSNSVPREALWSSLIVEPTRGQGPTWDCLNNATGSSVSDIVSPSRQAQLGVSDQDQICPRRWTAAPARRCFCLRPLRPMGRCRRRR